MILKLIFVIDMMIQQERSHAMSKHMRMLQAMASLESSPPIWSLSFSRYIAVKNVDLCGDGDRLWWPWWWFVYFLRDLVLTPFLKTPIFQLTGTMYFSGVTGCQRRGRGGGAINGKRGTKVSQSDTPEDMSCPMTWWQGKWQGNLSQTFQRCIVLHKPNSRGAGTFLMETTSSTGWKIPLSFILSLSSILSTSENILNSMTSKLPKVIF